MQEQNTIVIYTSEDGNTNLQVNLKDDTVWLNRSQIAELFARDVKTIGKHINNALKEELAGEPVVAKFATTKKYGKKTDKEATLDKKQVMEKRMMLEAFIKEQLFCQNKKEFAKLLDIRESNFSPNFEKEYNKMRYFVLKNGLCPTLKENEQLYRIINPHFLQLIVRNTPTEQPAPPCGLSCSWNIHKAIGNLL